MDDGEGRSRGGLYLPAGVAARERVQTGRVVQVGPGVGLPNPDTSEPEPWEPPREAVRYLPLPVRPGDTALFLRAEAVGVEFDGAAYLIVPQAAILAYVRPDDPEASVTGEALRG